MIDNDEILEQVVTRLRPFASAMLDKITHDNNGVIELRPNERVNIRCSKEFIKWANGDDLWANVMRATPLLANQNEHIEIYIEHIDGEIAAAKRNGGNCIENMMGGILIPERPTYTEEDENAVREHYRSKGFTCELYIDEGYQRRNELTRLKWQFNQQ